MKYYLDMSVNEPVEFKIFIVVPEGVNELLRHLQQPHVEEELNNTILVKASPTKKYFYHPIKKFEKLNLLLFQRFMKNVRKIMINSG